VVPRPRFVTNQTALPIFVVDRQPLPHRLAGPAKVPGRSYLCHRTSPPQFSETGADSVAQAYTYDYTFYFDWLHQAENVLAECRLSEKETLQLTNKHLCVGSAQRPRTFPLHQLRRLELSFKRLMFPLVLGGIVAPISLVALFNGLTSPLFGVSLAFVGLLLLYYGWLGAYQVRLHFHTQTVAAYFADARTARIEHLVQVANGRLAGPARPT
jgi:hypothetical protein